MKKQDLLMTLEELYGAIEINEKVYYLNQEPYLTGTLENPEVRVTATTKDYKSFKLIWNKLNMEDGYAFKHICDWQNPNIMEEIETPDFILEMLD